VLPGGRNDCSGVRDGYPWRVRLRVRHRERGQTALSTAGQRRPLGQCSLSPWWLFAGATTGRLERADGAMVQAGWRGATRRDESRRGRQECPRHAAGSGRFWRLACKGSLEATKPNDVRDPSSFLAGAIRAAHDRIMRNGAFGGTRQTAGDDTATARIDLLFSRMGFILFCGAVVYPLFFILDWRERPWDRPAALVIRVATTLVILALARMRRTAWGQPRSLLLASAGFLAAQAGFAVIVWHAKGLGSSNGDAFELFFGPYCVLVPAPTGLAAVVGAVMMCIQLAIYALSGTPVHYDEVA
jgi:hypothetical protein